jgi:hypothetical protein
VGHASDSWAKKDWGAPGWGGTGSADPHRGESREKRVLLADEPDWR